MIEFLTQSGTIYQLAGNILTNKNTGVQTLLRAVYQDVEPGRGFKYCDSRDNIIRTSPVVRILASEAQPRRLRLVTARVTRPITYLVDNDKRTILRDFKQALGGADNIKYQPVALMGDNVVLELSGII